MNYKMIVLDLDGTLVNSEKKISEKNKKALQKAIQKGVKVVLASGRPVKGVLPKAIELELDKNNGYILAFNGGRIINVTTKQCVFEADLPEGHLQKVYELSRKFDIGLMTYEGNDKLVTEDDNEYIQLELRVNQLERVTPKSIIEYVTFPVAKYLLAGNPENVEKAEIVFKQALSKQLNIFRSDPFFLEVLPLGIDKAYGLEKLIKILGISKEEVIACGDGYNDITMLQFAGLGVAMENATEQTKAAADYITLSNDEDGIAAVIEKFIL
ncbi:Cof-type HAD-IIB family hydrolase [Clostridium sp. MD294]|uniref:Cof-type HAD-IIB family hydrolase n=1 Tax=Clostridium sp. MD294 TaxID=97138 RepID=UPI0002CB1FA3|nr:Cof-type HAD-IIB family hydrolase [Clostridium sp. MD294]NDO46934.1 Cof-type HAD-IIB family hydrolase [Clostridium sp. MD294]USF31403.1 Sugar phosphatase YidA [Clostridium sp. MD294]